MKHVYLGSIGVDCVEFSIGDTRFSSIWAMVVDGGGMGALVCCGAGTVS